MDVFLLIAQRKETYPGEYAPEALECMDEYGYSENPEWLDEKKAAAQATGEFERVEIMRLAVDSRAIMRILRPAAEPVVARVIG